MIINSRTGSVVMNREVALDNCAVAQGNLSVTVNQQALASRIRRLAVVKLLSRRKRRSICVRAVGRCKACAPAPT